MTQDAVARKRALRVRLRAERAALDPQARARASAAVCAALRGLPELGAEVLVAAYAATAVEVDLDPWLRERLATGAPVVLPWVDGHRLGLAPVGDLDRDLAAGWRGLREPRPELRNRQIEATEVGAAVVPGVAFDAAGRRLGQGGGHVDRLLARLAPGVPVIGVAFSGQLVEAVPVEAHDARVNVVVTDRGVHRAAPADRSAP